MNPDTPLTYKMPRRVKSGGSGCAALVFFLLALACGAVGLFAFWPALLPAGILLGLAILSDSKTRIEHHCGHCGNPVASTSRSCPHCRADLLTLPWHRRIWH
ncbi:MAG TPA: hypothetical protein DIT13_02460 [Verrucomicrobiales bacterium]|nr:hypothetical protein [Verrucomicrobiales bacterium]HRJ10664.1 hypothetical protein [Prosthecobacter sp.]HRK16528.1 hypothetical protein [Prosthecobacter sp.]